MANDGNGQGPSRILVPKDRVFERNHGCFDCKHWDRGGAKSAWEGMRQRDLASAAAITTQSIHGENDPRVVAIRRRVDALDHTIAAGAAHPERATWAPCTGGGVLENGEPVGDLAHRTLLCQKWTGVQGAAGAGALDTLPAELRDKVDN